MAEFQVRPFEPAVDDYDALAALWTSLHPDLPRQAEIWRERDAHPEPGVEPWGRFVAERAGALVGMGEFTGCPLAGEPGQLQLSYAVPPGEDASTVLDALNEAIDGAVRAHQPPLLVGYARDTQPWMVGFYERQGYEAIQRTASSELRAPFRADMRTGLAREVLRRGGYTLCTAADLAADTDDWPARYHDLEQTILADVPFLGPVHREPLERFHERCEDPDRWNPFGVFLAVEEASGALVGLSQLQTFQRLPGYAFAGLTGVLPAHRRRGIARELKRATISFAKANGVQRIVALNEVDNPMLTLNRELGFETQHVQLTMGKRVTPGVATSV